MTSNYKSKPLLSFVENFPWSSIRRLIKKGKKERGQRLKDFIFYLSHRKVLCEDEVLNHPKTIF
jgi:hypothetical protein